MSWGATAAQAARELLPQPIHFNTAEAPFIQPTTHITQAKLCQSEKKWPLPWSRTMREVTIIILFVTIVVRELGTGKYLVAADN